MSRHAESDDERLDNLAAEMPQILESRPDRVGEDQVPLEQRVPLTTDLDVPDDFDPADYPHALNVREG